jgi:dTDP-4-amino-4,6-dideoxygalactose transaminase
MATVRLSAPDVTDLEMKYVQEAIASGWVAPAGPDLTAFEKEMSARVGVPYAIALSSGTAALHLGLLALGVGPGDVVLTSTMTFAATANAITYTGADPFFVDSERLTGNVDVALLAEATDRTRAAGRRIGAILPVDLFGKCAELVPMTELADALAVPMLEDAAESVGATHDGRQSGSFGAAAVFSFNGNKVMTTSGGGMLLTSDRHLADRVRYLSTQARQPAIHYEHTEVGYNYRLSNVLAAIGRAQLVRLDDMIARRRQIRTMYRTLFDGVHGVTVFGADDSSDNCWLSAILVDDDAGWAPALLAEHLRSADIESRPLWKPMHLQPAFARAQALVNGNAQWLFEHGLALPSGSELTANDLDRVCDAIQSFLAAR